MKTGTPDESVAEFQGLYGPYTVSERLLQKIWLRRDFNLCGARTLCGEDVEIQFPGKWNRLAGPDFRDARLRIGGREVFGDVEIHFRPADWRHHGHGHDPAYNRVVLHVVLFGEQHSPTETADGAVVPQMELVTLLHHDLEAYAADDVIEEGFEARHWKALEELLLKPEAERRRLLLERARERWETKVHFAGIRIHRAGWEEACHLTALEILGYRRNRPAMLDVATRFPLRSWTAERASPDEIQTAFAERWHVGGTRPANDPRHRISQYSKWIERRGAWPERLTETLLGKMPRAIEAEEASGVFRRRNKVSALRRMWSDLILADAVSGRRRETLFCDGFFPLVAASRPETAEKLFSLWFHWYPGDFPDAIYAGLRTAGMTDGRRFPLSNGSCQGLLGLTLDRPDSVSL